MMAAILVTKFSINQQYVDIDIIKVIILDISNRDRHNIPMCSNSSYCKCNHTTVILLCVKGINGVIIYI